MGGASFFSQKNFVFIDIMCACCVYINFGETKIHKIGLLYHMCHQKNFWTDILPTHAPKRKKKQKKEKKRSKNTGPP